MKSQGLRFFIFSGTLFVVYMTRNLNYIRMKTKELPVLLLTGYLGSGKTTLLNRILGNKKGIKFAVIVNDIGEVNIDAALIEKGGVVGQKDDSLVALQNGCICCTLKMDLVEQLKEIADMKKFDYIVIEASGICEPAPIAQTICSIPSLGPEYIKNGVLRLRLCRSHMHLRVTLLPVLQLLYQIHHVQVLCSYQTDQLPGIL